MVPHQRHGVSQSLATDVHALVLHVVQPLMKQGPLGKFCTHRSTLVADGEQDAADLQLALQ